MDLVLPGFGLYAILVKTIPWTDVVRAYALTVQNSSSNTTSPVTPTW